MEKENITVILRDSINYDVVTYGKIYNWNYIDFIMKLDYYKPTMKEKARTFAGYLVSGLIVVSSLSFLVPKLVDTYNDINKTRAELNKTEINYNKLEKSLSKTSKVFTRENFGPRYFPRQVLMDE